MLWVALTRHNFKWMEIDFFSFGTLTLTVRNIGIQMNRKELSKSFMMFSHWKKPFDFHDLYKQLQRIRG